MTCCKIFPLEDNSAAIQTCGDIVFCPYEIKKTWAFYKLLCHDVDPFEQLLKHLSEDVRPKTVMACLFELVHFYDGISGSFRLALFKCIHILKDAFLTINEVHVELPCVFQCDVSKLLDVATQSMTEYRTLFHASQQNHETLFVAAFQWISLLGIGYWTQQLDCFLCLTLLYNKQFINPTGAVLSHVSVQVCRYIEDVVLPSWTKSWSTCVPFLYFIHNCSTFLPTITRTKCVLFTLAMFQDQSAMPQLRCLKSDLNRRMFLEPFQGVFTLYEMVEQLLECFGTVAELSVQQQTELERVERLLKQECMQEQFKVMRKRNVIYKEKEANVLKNGQMEPAVWFMLCDRKLSITTVEHLVRQHQDDETSRWICFFAAQSYPDANILWNTFSPSFLSSIWMQLHTVPCPWSNIDNVWCSGLFNETNFHALIQSDISVQIRPEQLDRLVLTEPWHHQVYCLFQHVCSSKRNPISDATEIICSTYLTTNREHNFIPLFAIMRQFPAFMQRCLALQKESLNAQHIAFRWMGMERGSTRIPKWSAVSTQPASLPTSNSCCIL